MRILKGGIFFLSMLFVAPCVSASYKWPTKDWSMALPSQVGADEAELERLLAYVFPEGLDWSDRSGVRTEALIIIKDGFLVYERYNRGYHADSRHLAWSMTKLALNAFTGIAERKGLIRLSDKVASKENLSIKDLLAWSSGIKWQETYEYNPLSSSVLAMLYGEGVINMPQFVASKPSHYAPGSHYDYSSGDSNLLMSALRKAIGEKAYPDFPWKELFDRIGMKSAVLERDQAGNFVASSYMHATARDMAKLGLLYLNDGVWGNERILPEGWIFSSSQIVPAYRQSALALKNEWLSPGYHLWLNRADKARDIQKVLPDAPESTMAALGHWGQSMWMLPSERLVVLRLADDRDRSFSANRFLRLVLNAFPGSR